MLMDLRVFMTVIRYMHAVQISFWHTVILIHFSFKQQQDNFF